jgi:hypothetical protein
MSPTTHPSRLRTLSVAGIITAAATVAPAAAYAQHAPGERVLLTRVALPASGATSRTLPPLVDPSGVLVVDGERALLARTATGQAGAQMPVDTFAVRPMDGARTLLGRARAPEAVK